MNANLKIIYDYYKLDQSPMEYKKSPMSKLKLWCNNFLFGCMCVVSYLLGKSIYCSIFIEHGLDEDRFSSFCYTVMYVVVLLFMLYCGIFMGKVYVGHFDDSVQEKEEFGNIFNIFTPLVIVGLSSLLFKFIGLMLAKEGIYYLDDLEGGSFFLFYLPVVQAVVLLICSVIGIGVGYLLNAKMIDKCEKVRKHNIDIARIKQTNRKNCRIIKELGLIDDKTLKYMANAINYHNAGNEEDALANVRRMLESYLYARMEYDDVVFVDESQMTIFGIIEYYTDRGLDFKKNIYYWEYGMEDFFVDSKIPLLHAIREECNDGVHVLKGIKTSRTSENAINSMLLILADDKEIFQSNSARINELNAKMDTYVMRAKEHAENENDMDALLNIRKALECVVNGYLKYFHIRCTYGHEKNVSGYIDLLYEKKYITENSKSNLHKIRAISNGGAHVGNERVPVNTLLEMLDLIEVEVNIYKTRTLDSDLN